MDEIRCLNCGGVHILKVEYGMPDDAMVARIEAGEILHGGCIVEGLTQSLFCLDCDTRFDPISTPEFMSSLRQINFICDGKSIEIVLEHNDFALVTLRVTREGQTTRIANPNDLVQLARCGLEFWNQRGYQENREAGQWRLEMITDGYFRNLDIQSGNQRVPYAFAKWLQFLDKLTISG